MNKDFLNLISKESLTSDDFSNGYIYELYNLIHNVNSEEEDIKVGFVEDKGYVDMDKDGNRYYHYDYNDLFEAVYLGNRYDDGKLNAIFIFDSKFSLSDEIKIGSDFDLDKLKEEFKDYEIINNEMFSIELETGRLNIVSLNGKINEFEFYFN